MSRYYYLLTILYLYAPLSSASSLPNEIQTNELQQFPAALPDQKPFQNDLYEQPELERQQRQRVSSVLNGNYATYVEPPANFKPIIYDNKRQQSLQQDQFIVQPSATVPQVSLAQPLDPLMLSSSGYENKAPAIQEQQSQPQENQAALKPSIGRWNDWHDMSVEPDLAASDSQASNQPRAQFYIPGRRTSLFRTRYRTPPMDGSTKSAVKGGQRDENSRLALNTINSGGIKQQLDEQAAGAKSAIKKPSFQFQRSQRSKRRRKSKSGNAEVRIQKLVAASQAKQQLQSRQHFADLSAKQVNGLGQQQQSGANDSGQQQRHVDHRVAPAQQRAATSSMKSNLDEIAGGERQQGETAPAERVLSRPDSGVIKRFGSIPQAQAAAKKVVKRRRIKTQLPVGLSSWFLGGIRDLDGRHWQLPAEVMTRLAVNDVDFATYSAPTAKPEVDQSSSFAVVQGGPQQPPPHHQRPSINHQQIPR